ncbi:MAG: hypothetical protein ACFFD1_05525 [Candidatus Thorarchaeota archaeon]
MYWKGFLKLTLAHHPLCFQYKSHVLRVGPVSLCLGCSGFYSGFFLSLILVFLGLFNRFSWEVLVIVSFVLYLPTILRIIKIPIFSSEKKTHRFIWRFLLGFGVGTGLLSITIAPNIFYQLIQLLLGFGLYIGLTLARIYDKDAWKECESCTFTRGRTCFGFKQFYFPDDIEVIYRPQEPLSSDINN